MIPILVQKSPDVSDDIKLDLCIGDGSGVFTRFFPKRRSFNAEIKDRVPALASFHFRLNLHQFRSQFFKSLVNEDDGIDIDPILLT